MSDATGNPLIRLVNIHKAYVMGNDLVPVLRGVNLEVFPGEFVAIMGASGSGKSTLLHIAGALDRPDTHTADGVPLEPRSEVFFQMPDAPAPVAVSGMS